MDGPKRMKNFHEGNKHTYIHIFLNKQNKARINAILRNLNVRWDVTKDILFGLNTLAFFSNNVLRPQNGVKDKINSILY